MGEEGVKGRKRPNYSPLPVGRGCGRGWGMSENFLVFALVSLRILCGFNQRTKSGVLGGFLPH